jgi:hypothetical protein
MIGIYALKQEAQVDKIFLGYEPCQLVRTTDISGTISVWRHIRFRLSPAARDWSWGRANRVLVGRVISLFVLVLSLDWFILILLYHVSQWVSDPTETETPILAEVYGVEPDLSGSFVKGSL